MSESFDALRSAFPQFSCGLVAEVLELRGDEARDALEMLASYTANVPTPSLTTPRGTTSTSQTPSPTPRTRSPSPEKRSEGELSDGSAAVAADRRDARPKSSQSGRADVVLGEELFESLSCPTKYEIQGVDADDLETGSWGLDELFRASIETDGEASADCKGVDDTGEQSWGEPGEGLATETSHPTMPPLNVDVAQSVEEISGVGEVEETTTGTTEVDTAFFTARSAFTAVSDSDREGHWTDDDGNAPAFEHPPPDGARDETVLASHPLRASQISDQTSSVSDRKTQPLTEISEPSCRQSLSESVNPDEVAEGESISEQMSEEDVGLLDCDDEYVMFVQKSTILEHSHDEGDVTGPDLPPGIPLSPPGTDRGGRDALRSVQPLPEPGAEVSVAGTAGVEPLKSEVPGTGPAEFQDRLKLHVGVSALGWNSVVLKQCHLLMQIVQEYEKSISDKERRAKEKVLRIRVAQISRSHRQVEMQVKEVMKFLMEQDSPEAKIFCLQRLARLIVNRCSGAKETSITPLAYFASYLSKYFPELLLVLLGYLHKMSPLTVPVYWSCDPTCFHARQLYEEKMQFDHAAEDARETMARDDAYLQKHEGIYIFYAALIAVAPKNRAFGAEAGWAYLARFLNWMPVDRLTAYCLFSFLKIAGHVLHLTYKCQFLKILSFVQKQWLAVAADLDDSAMGALSRLKTFLSHNTYLEFPEILSMPDSEESRRTHA